MCLQDVLSAFALSTRKCLPSVCHHCALPGESGAESKVVSDGVRIVDTSSGKPQEAQHGQCNGTHGRTAEQWR